MMKEGGNNGLFDEMKKKVVMKKFREQEEYCIFCNEWIKRIN